MQPLLEKSAIRYYFALLIDKNVNNLNQRKKIILGRTIMDVSDCLNVEKIKIFVIYFIFMLREVLFSLYISLYIFMLYVFLYIFRIFISILNVFVFVIYFNFCII